MDMDFDMGLSIDMDMNMGIFETKCCTGYWITPIFDQSGIGIRLNVDFVFI
jgi:hypothetical protein